MSNIIVQGNEINAKEYVEKITIEGIGEEKSLNPRLIVAKGGEEENSFLPFDQLSPNIVINHSNIRCLVNDNPMYNLYSDNNSTGTYFARKNVNNENALGVTSHVYGNRVYIFFKKFSNKIKKIYIDMEAESSSLHLDWARGEIRFISSNDTIYVNQYSTTPNTKVYTILSNTATPEYINNQVGLTINVSNKNLLNRQTLIFDKTKFGIDDDFYLLVFVNDMSKWLMYNIYTE